MDIAGAVLAALLKRYTLPRSLAELIYYLIAYDVRRLEQLGRSFAIPQQPPNVAWEELRLYTAERLNAYNATWTQYQEAKDNYIDPAQVAEAHTIAFNGILSRLPPVRELDRGAFHAPIKNLIHMAPEEYWPYTWWASSRFQVMSKSEVKKYYPHIAEMAVPQLIHYLRHTIWYKLINFNLSFDIPEDFEHTYILGSTGSGKTQLLQQLISQKQGTVIVIDSQGDLINTLKHSKLFDASRLVIIDPQDSVRYPLALNMFDVRAPNDPVAFERHMNGVVELLNFVFSSVMDSKLTDKQSVVFNFCIRLMLITPGATIHTLVDVLEGGVDKYAEYVTQLPDIAQRFFANAFTQKKNEYDETKAQILRRLFSLLENPVIERLFKSEKNMFDMAREMDAGKVILISTDKGLLKSQGAAFFGRFFLSLVAQAMQERQMVPAHKRTPVHVFIDEAGDYLNSEDVNITDILEKGRKYKVNITIAHQHIQQLPPGVFQSIKTNTSTKFVGVCSASDSRALAEDMHTDHFPSEKLSFAMYSRNYAKHPVMLKVTPGIVEGYEKRDAREMEMVIAENRARYTVTGKGAQAPRPPQPEPDDDEFESLNKS